MEDKPYIDLGEIYANPKSKVAHIGGCRPDILNKIEVKDHNGNTLRHLLIKEAKIYNRIPLKIGKPIIADTEIALNDIPNLCAYCKDRILRHLELSKQLMLPKREIHNLPYKEAQKVIRYAQQQKWEAGYGVERSIWVQVSDDDLPQLRQFIDSLNQKYIIE